LGLPTPFSYFFFLENFFYIGIPFPTSRAFAKPLGTLSAAVLTEKGGFDFSHFKIGDRKYEIRQAE
jgi:hypothetical protein